MNQNSSNQGSFIRNIINRCLSLCSSVILIIGVSSIIYPLKTYSADVTGIWKADIESQIGLLKYTFLFKQDGNIITGRITADINGEKHEVDLLNGKIEGDIITFVELVNFDGNEFRISYTGKVAANEINFTRQVGDFGSDTFIAKRENAENRDSAAAERPKRPMMQPIVLGPDDKPAFAAAPEGFDKVRENIARGKIDTVEYTSITVGTTRKMLIYTPPGYSPDKKYPVLYLLHGIGGDELEWYNNGAPDVILDNLYADKKLVPMIVVLPNGRAMKDDRSGGNIYDAEKVKAFATFEQDLLNDVIPFVESKYPVITNRENRALAGLSMGGGQSLNFGLGNLNTFAWIGGFSSAPNTKASEVLVPNPAETAQKLRLLWVSCGDQDGLISFSQGLHKYLKENNVPHVWHVEPGVHDFKVWKNDLYLFTQLIFR